MKTEEFETEIKWRGKNCKKYDFRAERKVGVAKVVHLEEPGAICYVPLSSKQNRSLLPNYSFHSRCLLFSNNNAFLHVSRRETPCNFRLGEFVRGSRAFFPLLPEAGVGREATLYFIDRRTDILTDYNVFLTRAESGR